MVMMSRISCRRKAYVTCPSVSCLSHLPDNTDCLASRGLIWLDKQLTRLLAWQQLLKLHAPWYLSWKYRTSVLLPSSLSLSSATQHQNTPCRNLRSVSANLLSVTRCNISFGARGFRSAAPAIWNSLPSNVRSCETLTTFRRHLKSHLFHSAFATA